jgi:hypothetical protein
MNPLLRSPYCIRLFMPCCLALLLAGCTTPRIDWAARIGNYTYDQAILDFGPPDKSAKLTDGTIGAEWLERRGYPYAYTPFGYYSPGYYGPFPPAYVESYSPDYFLRLTFDPDSNLKAWKNFYK